MSLSHSISILHHDIKNPRTSCNINVKVSLFIEEEDEEEEAERKKRAAQSFTNPTLVCACARVCV